MSAALVCGLPRLGRGRPPPVARTAYENEVQAFCTVSSKSTLDSNSRPAAALGYLLEGEGTITKGELDAAQRLISDCRKSGLLPDRYGVPLHRNPTRHDHQRAEADARRSGHAMDRLAVGHQGWTSRMRPRARR